ncbi:hypothetical protein [Kingella oralis]|uniref:hypothetical protein n=1 Tax=Kingella oralis TaxID=505 RepID=UPI002D8007E0|nr:hypothetical protein [Kingella oralis]
MDIHPFSMSIFLFCEKGFGLGNLILTRAVRCSPFLGSLRILVFQTTFMFSTGIKATPNGSGKPKTLWRSWKTEKTLCGGDTHFQAA